ncbi:MAG: divalent-cation tolerance protein CutA [Fuerstiella sp.]
MSGNLIQVQTTVNCPKIAHSIAEQLLNARLAACVQVSAAVTSHYVWEGQLQQQLEHVLAIKTIQAAWPKLKNLIQQIHPYDEPQIIALPIVEATDTFAEWVIDQVPMTSLGQPKDSETQ